MATNHISLGYWSLQQPKVGLGQPKSNRHGNLFGYIRAPLFQTEWLDCAPFSQQFALGIFFPGDRNRAWPQHYAELMDLQKAQKNRSCAFLQLCAEHGLWPKHQYGRQEVLLILRLCRPRFFTAGFHFISVPFSA